MKILIVTTGYPRDLGDMSGIFVHRLAQAMYRAGHQVTVLAPGDRHARHRGWDEGIEIVRFRYGPQGLMRLAYGVGGIPEVWHRSPCLLPLFPSFLCSMLIHVLFLSKRHDLIHAQWLHTGLLSLPAAMLSGKPLVVTFRGSDLKDVHPRLLDHLALNAAALTSVNRAWFQSLQSRYGRKVYFTPNGVSTATRVIDIRDRFGIADDEILFLFVGTLTRNKGVDTLATAAGLVREVNRSVRFLLVGPGDPAEFGLHRLCNITWAGRLSPAETLSVYGACDAFLLPSRHEGRPNALLEAMAAGLPSIATGLPGVREVLTPDCGILVDSGNSVSLSRAVLSLAADPAARKSMGKKAKSRIQELSLDWDSSASRYIRIFEEVLSCAG